MCFAQSAEMQYRVEKFCPYCGVKLRDTKNIAEKAEKFPYSRYEKRGTNIKAGKTKAKKQRWRRLYVLVAIFLAAVREKPEKFNRGEITIKLLQKNRPTQMVGFLKNS